MVSSDFKRFKGISGYFKEDIDWLQVISSGFKWFLGISSDFKGVDIHVFSSDFKYFPLGSK